MVRPRAVETHKGSLGGHYTFPASLFRLVVVGAVWVRVEVSRGVCLISLVWR